MSAFFELLRLGLEPKRDYDSLLFLKAVGENLAFTIAGSLFISWLFNPAVLHDNPIRRMMGYNNPCVSWDTQPAIFFATPMFAVNVYWAIRYTTINIRINKLRMGSLHQATRTQRCTWYATSIMDWSFVWSLMLMMNIFVVTPFSDGQSLKAMRLHMVFFVQFIPLRYVVVLTHFLAAVGDGYILSKGQMTYIFVYGLFTAGLSASAISTMIYYRNDGRHVVNPTLGQFVDWGWFCCLPLSTNFLPDRYLLTETSEVTGNPGARAIGVGIADYQEVQTAETVEEGAAGSIQTK